MFSILHPYSQKLHRLNDGQGRGAGAVSISLYIQDKFPIDFWNLALSVR